MTRHCAIDNCTNPARPSRRICFKHRTRLARHGDPDFTQWTVADEYDVELIVRDPRPVHGLTRLERRLVAASLTQRGTPADEIARLLNVTPRTVYRWRATQPAA